MIAVQSGAVLFLAEGGADMGEQSKFVLGDAVWVQLERGAHWPGVVQWHRGDKMSIKTSMPPKNPGAKRRADIEVDAKIVTRRSVLE